jgi:hypothetical protein
MNFIIDMSPGDHVLVICQSLNDGLADFHMYSIPVIRLTEIEGYGTA